MEIVHEFNAVVGARGFSPADSNLISGNVTGVSIAGGDRNSVAGNFIGTDRTGRVALPNRGDGVAIFGGSRDNRVGSTGPTQFASNLISGNLGAGVSIAGTGTSGNLVEGNSIGVDVTGGTRLGNGRSGVSISGGASANQIVASLFRPNTISGNGEDGVVIDGEATRDNRILGNIIGLDSTGSVGLGNGRFGVAISAPLNVVGVDFFAQTGLGNVISGNGSVGVSISGPSAFLNQVEGYQIGTNSVGTVDLGNARGGLVISGGAQSNSVGLRFDPNGFGPIGISNLIAGKGDFGVGLEGSETAGNQVFGNMIGIVGLGNDGPGVTIFDGALNNRIGHTPSFANTIAANAGGGVRISGAATSGNSILSNNIGTDEAGAVDLGNLGAGVIIFDGASDNFIGAGEPGRPGNRIAFNRAGGVTVAYGERNYLFSNLIHDNAGDAQIDLGGDGATPNDPGDLDEGATGLQNTPSLDVASSGRGRTFLRGTIDTRPNRLILVQFFADPTLGPTGIGRGRTFLGEVYVRTDAFGDGRFRLVLPALAPVGHFVSATATEESVGDPIQFSTGSTSEFSAAVPVRAATPGESASPPGDFDGDGRTDIAIFDQTTSTIIVLNSVGNSTVGGAIIRQFGNPGHRNVPVPADFDGDGKADVAIYDLTSSTIFALRSAGRATIQQFGNPDHLNVPVHADYDGDGRTDLGIYDQSTSQIISLLSGGGALIRQFGDPSHRNVPVPSSYGEPVAGTASRAAGVGARVATRRDDSPAPMPTALPDDLTIVRPRRTVRPRSIARPGMNRPFDRAGMR